MTPTDKADEVVAALRKEASPERREEILSKGWDKAVASLYEEVARSGEHGDYQRLIFESWIIDGKDELLLEAADLIASMKAEREDERRADDEQMMALCAKIQALAPHGTCACSYDAPDDRCMHHSPQLVAAEAQLATLKARLAEVLTGARELSCPRPFNGRPDDFTAGQCVDAGECGCCAHVLSLLSTREGGDKP